MSVPALRFKEFSGDWEVKKLGDLSATFKSGSGITSEHISNYGSYPVYGGNGLRGYTDSFTHDGFYLLIGRQGALCGNINRSFGKAYISEHAIAVCANETSNTEWLSQKLNLLNLNRLSESSAQPGLAVNKLIKLEFETPSLPEQTKIANFLTAVDQKISLLTQKADLLSQYKKGVMQQIFKQELRFKDDDGQEFPEWEVKALGDEIDFLSGFAFDGDEIKEDCAGVRLMRGVNITEGTIRGGVGIDRFYEGSVDKLTKYFLIENDLVIGMDGSKVGKNSALITKKDADTLLVQRVARLRAKPNSSINYIFQNINSNKFHSYVDKVKTSSGIPHISAKQIKEFEIIFPSLPEQTKIANFLTAIDEKITNNQTQLNVVKQYKQGLLQQMFV
jgi:type I restriction enzyme, S subunit